MCRVYKSKGGWYVRLCYYHRERCGEHIPVPDGFELSGRHYPRQGSTRQVGNPPRRRQDIPRCRYCGTCLSRDSVQAGDEMCRVCWEHPERRPPLPHRSTRKAVLKELQ